MILNIFLLSLFAIALAQRQPQGTAKCSAVHIIAARGSGEAKGYGIIQSLVDQLKRQIPGATSEPLDYPAVLQYARSTPVGVTNMKKRIAEYTGACPTAKLVLVGYSQGGAVTVDTLCGGGGGSVGPSTPGLTAEEGKLIKAAVSFGDPRFVPGVSYALGTNKGPKGGVSVVRSRFLRRMLMLSGCDEGPRRLPVSDMGEHHPVVLRRQRFALRQRHERAGAHDVFESVPEPGGSVHCESSSITRYLK